MQTDPISAAHAYRMALEAVMQARVLHEARQAAQHALDITFTKPEPGQISVASGYGQNTKQPFVTIGIANPTESANPTVQLVVETARQIAMQILEASDAAESDGFIVKWLTSAAGLAPGQVGALLAEFRAYRERRRGQQPESE